MNIRTHSVTIASLLLLSALLFSAPVLAKSSLDGQIAVANARHSVVSVKIDGEPMGVIFPGKRRILSQIPNGVRLLVISGKHGPPITRRVSVPIQGRAKVRVAPRLGSARIHNNSTVRMKVSINDRFVGTVAPGRSLIKPRLRTGQHTVTATPTNYRLARSGSLSRTMRVRAGERAQLSLGKFFGRVRVTNSNERRVRVYLDGDYKRHLGAGQSYTMNGLTPGAHRISLKRRGRTISTTTVRIDFGQVAYWKPQPIQRGKLRVANRSHRPISVSVDGRNTVRVAPGQSRTMRRLSAGVHNVTITRHRGRVEQRRVRVPRSEEAVVTVFSRRNRHAHRNSGSVYVAGR